MQTKDDVLQAIQFEAFTADVKVIDTKYSLPTKEWVNSQFAESFNDYQTQMQSTGWWPEVNDCDDKAVSAWEFARRCHRLTVKSLETSIAFGLLFYQTSRGGHAINIYLTKDQDSLQVHFWEPQTQRDVQLTDKEKDSIWFVML